MIALPVLLAAAVTASASGYALITVRPGDTLSALAARYHTTVARLIALNHLPGNGDLIYAGSQLRVPGAGHHHHRHHHHHRQVAHYTVQPGDTLYGLAARFHANPAVIARRNHLPSSLVIMIGQRLAIPHHRHHGHHRRHAAHHRVGGGGGRAFRQERRILAHHAEPSRNAVAGLIRATAQRWHVDPRLALAISWQEAGFNMREVSATGAIGAMQVMPGTARYVAADIVHRPLNLYDAQDNVTAGVALVAVLVREASSERQAVAGYYQGLQSVRDHGMFRSTRQYVANVLALRDRF
ncbi:MAG TPA: LysM peptidoglycan-binding domain-containing protein [Mycobacteriales bacterium]|nr:LysM peptidoglycan-binding domain-containing protein [Mycobacteriales bacterium]